MRYSRSILVIDSGCGELCSITLYNGVWTYDDYFIWKKDVVENIGFSGHQSAWRMLAYGTSVDSWDEYLQMSKSRRLEAMGRFATTVVMVFGSGYSREPTI